MASKSEADAAAVLTCRVCGGEVNARKECVVCGTKQTDVPKVAGEQELAAWLRGDTGDNGLSTWVGAPVSTAGPPDAREESLKRWLAGEDTAFQDWIGTAAGGGAGRASRGERVEDDRLRELRAKAFEADGLRAELESMRETLARELGNFRNGKFDPIQYIEETANLSKQLQTEIAKRKELEQEIEHIKKGSIAVIKYVKGQQIKGGVSPEVRRNLDREIETRKKIEAEVVELRKVNEALKDRLEVGLAKAKPSERELRKREVALAEREAALEARASMAPSAGPATAEATPADEELKRRFEEELRDKEQDYLVKEEELKKRIIGLEEQVNKLKIEEQVRLQEKALEGKPKRDVEDTLKRKEQELLSKEKSMLLREQEIQRLQDELHLKEDEMKKLKEPLQYKEEEVMRREQDLTYRENLIQGEMRKLEQMKAEGISSDEKDLKGRLEELKAQITQKEEEVRTKESYLQHKMEELRLREQGMVEEEIAAREEDRKVEFTQQRVKTGISRLDDLLFGGIPYGSNVSVYGPAYVGKEVLVNLFIAEGLRKGLPVIWVLTDKSPADLREEMKFILTDDYDTYEKKGLVKYVDAYSKSMGGDADDPNAVYIDDPTDHGTILKAVDQIAAEFRKTYDGGYRLAFRSVSTLIAYLDPTTTFKFLQPFVGRRKRDKAVSMFIIEKGMHEEQEIQMLGSLMDGSLEFKVEQLKSFLQVKGVTDVQSRAWIRYTYTKNSVTIGSFSLDHIK